MSSKNNTDSPEGLWQACNSMESAAAEKLSIDLSPFRLAIESCYEAGVQAVTLEGMRHGEKDIKLAALFLKRSLNDLRSVWLLLHMGYTSQAGSVAASLFEHALAACVLAGSEENARLLEENETGDLPWSPIQLAKIYASNERGERKTEDQEFTEQNYDLRWREVYSIYKFLCKVKHPTLRSSMHDAPSTSVQDAQYVVMAAPDVRDTDLGIKATILTSCISRVLGAIEHFTESLECDKAKDYYKDFSQRISRAREGTKEAYEHFRGRSLPFNVSDDRISKEYFALRKKKDKIDG